MRPLERSLEKLDDVRKKKLAEMIAGSGSGGTSSGGGLSSTDPANKKGASVKSVNKKNVNEAGQLEIAKLTKPPEEIEPAEMNLEEIESRLGSLIQTVIISQLKSALWKEHLEAISSLKQQVEGLQDLDQSVEIFICLLCAIPGWNEKNVQVQQQVIEVVTYLASTATKIPINAVISFFPVGASLLSHLFLPLLSKLEEMDSVACRSWRLI